MPSSTRSRSACVPNVIASIASIVWWRRANAAAPLPRNVLCSATPAAISGCASWSSSARSQARTMSRSALMRRETLAAAIMSVARRRRRLVARGLLHQEDDAPAVLGGPDADALHAQADLPAAAVHRVDLGLEALVGLPRQPGNRLFELLDGQADVEPEEMPAAHFVGAQPPQVRGDVVPELHLQLFVEHDHRERDAAKDAAEKDIAARQIGAALAKLLVDGLELLVGGLELLVHRLELFVGGLELFVGGLELLDGGLELLVGRLELLVGRLKLLVRRLELLPRVLQLVLQLALPRDVGEDHLRAEGGVRGVDDRGDLHVEV